MDPSIDDYIRANRDRYTREAITQQLVDTGHDRAAVDAAWERLATEEPLAGAGQGSDLSLYVWIMYWLGAGIIVTIALIAGIGSGGGFILFGVGWLLAYLGLAYFPTRAIARSRPGSGAGAVLLIVAAPLVVVLIGGGICLATIAAFAATFSGGI